MVTVNAETRLRRNPNVVWRALASGQGGVLLHLDTGAYHSLNAVGQAIWDLVDEQRTVGEIVTALRERVSGAPPQLEADVVAFLDSALERNLVSAVD